MTLRVGYYSFSPDTPPRSSGPLRVGFYGVYTKWDANNAYHNALVRIKRGEESIREDYLHGMGTMAGFSSDKIKRDIAKITLR